MLLENGLESIGRYAFQNCKSITSITIPNSVTRIGDYAFFKCEGLATLVIGNGIKSIEEGVFSGCTGLKSVTIPKSITTIGLYPMNTILSPQYSFPLDIIIDNLFIDDLSAWCKVNRKNYTTLFGILTCITKK